MSLLLDALKRSGDKQQGGSDPSNLTLEDLPPSRAATSASGNTSGRTAGETMFAAKKKPKASRGWKLGLVPTTLLIALVFGSAYGYYVWLQIQPPAQPHIAQRTAPPAPPVAVAPMPHAAPALVPFIPPQPQPEKPAHVQPTQPLVVTHNEDFDAPRNKPKADRAYHAPTLAVAVATATATAGITIQHKVEADTVTPGLLDAYQAYQRGDYAMATQDYREVLGKDALNRDALLGLAAIAQQKGQDETAQQYYRQLLALDPHDPVAEAALMSYSPDTGNTESRLKLLLADQPRSATLHFALANYYAGISSWGDAQQHYFDAHTLEPSNAQFTFNLAVSLDHLAQRKLAAQYYQQALQLDTSSNSGFDHAQAQQRLNELTSAK